MRAVLKRLAYEEPYPVPVKPGDSSDVLVAAVHELGETLAQPPLNLADILAGHALDDERAVLAREVYLIAGGHPRSDLHVWPHQHGYARLARLFDEHLGGKLLIRRTRGSFLFAEAGKPCQVLAGD